MATGIIGTGSFLPPTVIDNNELAKLVKTDDEWIREHTGIVSRHIATDEVTSFMGAEAALKAIENAKIDPKEIDLIVFATVSPERATPSMSCIVQDKVGAVNATCFDVNAACSGFVYALQTVDAYIRSGFANKHFPAAVRGELSLPFFHADVSFSGQPVSSAKKVCPLKNQQQKTGMLCQNS